MRMALQSPKWILALLAVCVTCTNAFAQNNSVRFKTSAAAPSPAVEVKIQDGQPIEWDEQGNLNVVCVPNPLDNTTCDGISTSNGQAAVIGTFQFSNGSSALTIGPSDSLSATVNWTLDTSTDFCLVNSSPVLSGWNGSKVITANGSQVFTLTASSTADTNYSFEMTCYNADGSDAASGSKTITATVQQRTVVQPSNDCSITKGVGAGTDPLFQPDGYTGHTFQWTDAMFKGKDKSIYPNTNYPKMPSDQPPLGSFTLSGATMKNQYVSVEFTEITHATRFLFQWIQAVGYSSTPSYVVKPAGNIYVTISECPGDFRYTTVQKTQAERLQGDATYTAACRVVDNESKITVDNDSSVLTHCTTTPGKKYYLNVLIADPRDGFSTDPDTGAPVENTCDQSRSGFTGVCEAQFSSN